MNKLFYLPKKILKKCYEATKRKFLIKIKCTYNWCGTQYGGFYVCFDMFAHNSMNHPILIYSAGVGEDISFDIAIMQNFHCKLFAFDPTPKSIKWIQNQKLPDNFNFYPYGISDKTEEKRFYLSNTDLDISSSIFVHQYTSNDDYITVQMKSLDNIAQEHQHTYIDVLKMDIEGSEFAIIENFPDNITFGQIVIEFHERFLKNGKIVLKKAITQLKKKGYYCFAVSPSGQEYSFINKKEYKKRDNLMTR